MKKLRHDSKPIYAYASIETIEYYARKVLGWKTPTKHYTSIYGRLTHAGSVNYNKVVQALFDNGYKA